jgi:endonuclease YncB( thermonuclease family)
MMSFRRVVILVALAVAAGALGANQLRASPGGAAERSPEAARVVRVVDGDTIVASVGGRE